MKTEDICLGCYQILVEGKNVKRDWKTPLCENCRPVISNYLMNKDKIDRTIRARAVRQRGG